jgi:hypothetical protein
MHYNSACDSGCQSPRGNQVFTRVGHVSPIHVDHVVMAGHGVGLEAA